MRILIILAFGLVFAACGDSSEEGTVGKQLADDYNDAMDKARDVEEELKEHAEDIEKAVEEAEDALND